MIPQSGNPKNSTESIGTNFVKLQDTKLTHKNQLCFYTLTMNKPKRKLRIVPYRVTSKRKKYLGINLVKEIKDLYTEFKASLG